MRVLRCAFALMCLVLAAAAQSTLSGTVFDQSGAVIPGATVNLYSADLERVQVTDARGEFRFGDVPAGQYDIEVTARNFRKRIVTAVRVGSAEPTPMTITLDVGTSESCSDSRLDGNYTDSASPGISGVVSFHYETKVSQPDGSARWVATGGAVPDAKVSLQRQGDLGPALSAMTDRKGAFAFRDLRPGLYRITVSPAGYQVFAVSDVRIRRAKRLDGAIVLRDDGTVLICG